MTRQGIIHLQGRRNTIRLVEVTVWKKAKSYSTDINVKGTVGFNGNKILHTVVLSVIPQCYIHFILEGFPRTKTLLMQWSISFQCLALIGIMSKNKAANTAELQDGSMRALICSKLALCLFALWFWINFLHKKHMLILSKFLNCNWSCLQSSFSCWNTWAHVIHFPNPIVSHTFGSLLK